MNLESLNALELEESKTRAPENVKSKFAIDLIQTGVQGSVEVVPGSNSWSGQGLDVESTLFYDLWPLRSDAILIEQELSDKYLKLERNVASTLLLNSRSEIPQFLRPAFEIDPLDFVYTDSGPPVVDLEVLRDEITGDLDWEHARVVPIVGDKLKGPRNTFLDRAPAARRQDFIRGRMDSHPFAAGGISSNSYPTYDRAVLLKEKWLADARNLFSENPTLVTLPAGHGDEGVGDAPLEPQKFARIDEARPTDEADAEPGQEDYKEMLVMETRAKGDNRKWARLCSLANTEQEYQSFVLEPAKEFPFELDLFQKQAILELENERSVFIAAHTSAGKTVVAEYAIALALKHMTRAIYTSPIKALTNQKFRDFKDTFGKANVGILTGDVQVQPDAPCLTMTTEILRSMLYRGADLIRDTEFVIFDEVHYVNDASRGVVWEEVIIMLPAHVSLILLSATVPNALEFAEWVGRTKKTPVTVIATQHRPVPLEHHLFVDGKLTLVVDRHRQFQTSNYVALSRKLSEKQKKSSTTRSFAGMERRDKTLYVNFVAFLKKEGLLPCIVFIFSKNKCEKVADLLQNVDLTGGTSDKSEIHVFFQRSIARLSKDDASLPQVQRMYALVMRGIAVHHGGLLPILKEVVEMLFARGKIFLLLATETFAMGVNAPAKCVAFSSIRKHDGTQFRDLLPGEYTQMSGRAGRRGLDSRGTVIILPTSKDDSLPDGVSLQALILGTPTKLASQFRLTYTMILNLLRVDSMPMDKMMAHSFSENASQQLRPILLQKKAAALAELKRLQSLIETDKVLQFKEGLRAIRLTERITAMQVSILGHVAKRVLTTGRVVVVNGRKENVNDAVNFIKDKKLVGQGIIPVLGVLLGPIGRCSYNVAMLMPIPDSFSTETVPYGQFANVEAVSEYLGQTQVDLNKILCVCDWVIDRDNLQTLTEGDNDKPLIDLLQSYKERTAQFGYSEVDYNALKVSDLDFYLLVTEKGLCVEEHRKLLKSVAHLEDFKRSLAAADVHVSLERYLDDLEGKLSQESLQLMPDYGTKCNVLQVLGYLEPMSEAQKRLGAGQDVSQTGFTVTVKGQIACEINTVDPLLLSELILDQFFADYDAAEAVALLSALVFDERLGKDVDREDDLPLSLANGIQRMRDMAMYVNQVQRDCGLVDVSVDPEAQMQAVNPHLVHVVYQWSKGMAFKQIMELTPVLEGGIVRTIVRLVETCREVRDAARVIGNPDLYSKMEDATGLIKRDIVFAASLYL